MADEAHGAGERLLLEAAAQYVGAREAERMLAGALSRAKVRELPRDREGLTRFVEAQLVPILCASLPAARHPDVRATLGRVAGILGRALEPPAPVKPRFGEEAITQQIATRRFDEILVLSPDPELRGASGRLEELGARVTLSSAESIAADLARTLGTTALVVVDARRAPRAIEALRGLAAPEGKRLTAIVWGDGALAAEARTFLGRAPVVHMPAGATIEQLQTVVRLGPA
jgi:hypothetical protein